MADTTPPEDQEEVKTPFWLSVRRLLSLLAPCWASMIGCILLKTFRSWSSLMENVYGGKIVDALSKKDESDFIWQTTFLSLSYVAFSLFLFGESFVRSRNKSLLANSIKIKLYSTLMLDKPQTFFDQSLSSDIGSRLSSDVDSLSLTLSSWGPSIVAEVMEVLFGVTCLFNTHWKLTLIVLFATPFMAITTWLQAKWEEPLNEKYKDMLSDTNSRAVETLAQIKTVSIFGQQRRERRAFASLLAGLDILNQQITVAHSVSTAAMALAFNFGIAVSFWYGGGLVLAGDITPGEFLAFNLFSMTIVNSVNYLPELYSELTEMRITAARIFAVLEEDQKSGDSKETKKVDPSTLITPPKTHKVEGHIKFERVSFAYPNRPENLVLKDFDLEIKPGCSAALVGTSGGGKSTIISILMRLYEQYSGKITIDGYNLSELNPGWLRQQIGFVSQEPVLFSTTVRENICYGLAGEDDLDEIILGNDPIPLLNRGHKDFILEKASTAESPATSADKAPLSSTKKSHISRRHSQTVSQERLEEVAKMANAHDFIMELPHGYDTLVGERGSLLSGGQKQRIAIARALLRNPKILITDEATSALDNSSERIVQQALDRLMQGRTCIVIAHRLSTVRHCEPISYLSGGKVLETGTHEELMALENGHYRKLHSFEEQRDHLKESKELFLKQELRDSQSDALLVPPQTVPENPLDSHHPPRERASTHTQGS